MPKKNTKMFSNVEALREGARRAAWKSQKTREYFSKAAYRLDRAVNFDHRDVYSMGVLLIDISSVANASDSEQLTYFESKLKEIERDVVLTKDHSTRNPYFKRIYEETATSIDIDWDDPAQIDHLFSSILAQQMLGTIIEWLPREVSSLFPTKEDAEWLDNVNIENFVNLRKFHNLLGRHHPDLCKMVGLGAKDQEEPGYNILDEIVNPMMEAYRKKSNVIVLDPGASEVATKHFLDIDFNITTVKHTDPDDPEFVEVSEFNSDDAAERYLLEACSLGARTANEHILTHSYSKGDKDKRLNLLFINGKTAAELVAEKRKAIGDVPGAKSKATAAVGRMLRDAMVDGKSVITIMRPKLVHGNKIDFIYQELKVDMDKLNDLERTQKHNIFRRALDVVGIAKIPKKFSSNADRDERQAEFKNSIEYKKMLKNAENKFISTYNENAQKVIKEQKAKALEGKPYAAKDRLMEAIPVVVAANGVDETEYERNYMAQNSNPNRVRMFAIKEAMEEDEYDVAPKIEEDESKSLNIGEISK